MTAPVVCQPLCTIRKKLMQQVIFTGAHGQTLVADVMGEPDGIPVLLAHGGGQTRGAWRGTIRLLSETGFKAVALDLRGHGESAWSPDGRYAIGDFAADLVAVADQLDIRPHLIGASLGGLAGLVAEGEQRSGTFETLTLVDIAPHLDATGVTRVMDFMRAHLDKGFATVEDAAAAVARYAPGKPRSAEGIDGLRRYLRPGSDGRLRWHWDPRFIDGVLLGGAPADSIGTLSRAAANLNLPVHLIRGGMSDMVSDEGLTAFRALVPGAVYTDIAGAGHMVAGDQNDAFSQAAVAFLVANSGSAPAEGRDLARN